MMQSEKILPFWETFDIPCSNLDQSRLHDPQMDFLMWDNLDFSFSLTSPEESSIISTNSNVSTMFSDELFDLPNLSDDIFIPSPMEGLATISREQITDICGWINESDYKGNYSTLVPMYGEEYSPCFSLESSEDPVVFPMMNGSNTLPGDMEMDNETSLRHLIKAYGEATENKQQELARVIVNSIEEKSDPLGKTMERVSFYLFQLKQNQGEYLRQESLRNYRAAFKAFYQGLPYGRLAHFIANSAILEALPDDAETIHIVDFDIEEGIQWPPVIEAISRMHKALKFTMIKSDDECSSLCWDIEETKQRLQDHATELGLNLQIDQKSVSDLASEITRTKKRGRGREWLVFNCMFRLPHMARMRQRSHAARFLQVAKEILTNYRASAGMVTLGYGETEFCSQASSSFSSFLDKLLKHYQALFESLEQSFPAHLADARTAMESLFLAPYMSSLHWFLDSEKLMENSDLQSETGLEGQKLSEESIIEAKQIVNEIENAYKVKIEGHRKHEMVLEWKGTPLVRVSTWT
ncbi:nodulation-signaling pathway 2 protein-like [Olea europaea var. sylvestris]|uniref:nodulation-signaling pathway 2 protein-like n=1 Tax=Olea europaea var. sylvestris TaxID=158386 RepID=UPI000C1D6171|nr:nodulation-signaling pathway 2 protein-like [Olea europaea var. sylvestris]